MLKRVRTSLRGETLIIHSALRAEAAVAAIDAGLSGHWFPRLSHGDRIVLGRAAADSVRVYARRRNVTSVGVPVFKGRLVTEGSGCVLVGMLRAGSFARIWTGLAFGLGCLGAAQVWGLVVLRTIDATMTLSILGGAVLATCVPLAVLALYAGAVAYSAADAVYLRQWFSDVLEVDAGDQCGRGA